MSVAIFLIVLGAIGAVYAHTIVNSVLVNVNGPCYETDFGLDYDRFGSVTGNFWWLTPNSSVVSNYNGTFYDSCLNNLTLVEGVCGSTVSQNFSNLAGIVYVNCDFGCSNGACINSNSTNNTLRPDLIISNLTYTYVVNGSITINTNTTNSTNGTSTNGTTILRTYRVFVNATVRNSGNAVAGASTTLLMVNTNVLGISSVNVATPSLGVGQSTSVSGVLAGVTGIDVIQAGADYLSVVAESNEYNNGRMISATLP